MPNNIPAPAHDAQPGIDGNLSGSPMEGAGAYHALNNRSNECIFRGRVEDTYPAQGGCMVAVYALASNLACVIASDVQGRHFGARSSSVPPVGTEVVLYLKDGSNYGIILGVLPTIEDSKCDLPRPMICHEGGVNSISLGEAFNAEEFDITPQYLPDAGASSAVDIIPGDQGWSNDLNMFMGLLRSIAVLKGGEFSKVEAFAIDDLLRLTGYNLEELTSGTERRHINDNGAVTKEETIAFVQSEALGAPDDKTPIATEQTVSLKSDPEKIGLAPIVDRMIGKWRYREYLGYLGDMCHRLVSRPVSEAETLNDSEKPEGGVFSEHISRFGKVSSRSLAGMGMHKVDRIPVPRRKWFFGEIHDKQYPEVQDKEDFKLSDDQAGPAAAYSKLRDYFAYIFSAVVPARMYESKEAKELSLPENSECPDLALIKNVPQIGGFFREFPQDKDLSDDVDGLLEEQISTSTIVKPGHSWVDVLPDGSVSLRDIWGSSIEMRGGHIYISASKSIQMLAGESIVSVAGRDIIGKAKQSVDMTCTSGQMRLKSDRTMFLHSQSAGIQVTCPAESVHNSPMEMDPSYNEDEGSEELGAGKTETDEMIGELYDIPGFVVKSNTSTSIVSNIMSMYLSEAMYITNQDGEQSGQYPVIYRDISGEVSTLNDFGLFYRYGHDSDSYGYIGNGGFYGTGDVYVDGNGSFRKQLGYNFDNDKTIPTVEEQLAKDYPKDTDIDASYPFKFDAIPNIKFSYRSVDSYGTTDASWFESDWQRDLSSDLVEWQENPTEKTYPYPGTLFYTSRQKYYTYEEVNVDSGGIPKNRKQMSSDGGHLIGHTWNSIKVSQY